MTITNDQALFTEGVQIGKAGANVLQLVSNTVSIDPPSVATVSRGAATFTLTGARVGDVIIMAPPATLNDDLIFCGAEVTANDTVTVYLYNPTVGAIDDGALTWRYTWLDITR